MKPEIKESGEIRAVGYKFTDAVYSSKYEDNAAYWIKADFDGHSELPEEIRKNGKLSCWAHDADAQALYYFYGSRADKDYDGFETLVITPATYAIFLLTDAVMTDDHSLSAEKIRKESLNIIWSGLEKEGYKYDPNHGMLFEYYESGNAYLYIPVEKA